MKLPDLSNNGCAMYFGTLFIIFLALWIATLYLGKGIHNDNYEKDVKSIRHSAMLMDTIFMNVLDTASVHYMNPYILEQAKEQNKLIIEHISNF